MDTSKLISETAYMAVRKTDGREWVDLGSHSGMLDVSKAKAKKMDDRIPHWAKDNPVVRYAQFKVCEIPEVT